MEYKITVENAGNVALKFTALTDAHCSNISPSGQTELAPGAKESFTCEHTLAKGDEPVYINVASIEGCSKTAEKEGYTCGHGYGKTPGTSCKYKESNKVEVGVEPETPEFADPQGTAFPRRNELHDCETDGQNRPDRGIQDHG